MNNKIKMLIVKLVNLEDKILDIYREIIKKEIYNEDITNEIEKIKELKTQEKFLNNLTYQELTEILNYIENSEELYYMLIQRISNLINIEIDKNHLEERLEEQEEDIDEEFIEYTRKEEIIVEYLMRDLVLLKLKKLECQINRTNNEVRKRLINYKYLYFYSNVAIENEMINNKFNLNNIYLINKLAIQLSDIEKELIEDLYKEIAEQDILIGSIQNLININNIILSEGKNKENDIFLESEMVINTSFLAAEMEVFSIKKETIMEILNNKIERKNNKIIKEVTNLLNGGLQKNEKYLTLIRKK